MDRGWWVLTGVVAAAAGLVTALGGFAPAGAANPHRTGEVVALARWSLAAEKAELVPSTAEQKAELRIWFTVVNTATQTLPEPWDLVTVVTPEGLLEPDRWTVPDRSGGFDPDVPQQAFASVPVTGWTGEPTISIQIADERRSDTPAPIEVWSRTGIVARVDVVCRQGVR